ncbi:hypothetical protein [Nocardia farcinica]|uniref:hypothetical protein n=1 Tax=Nocardia farcinica TaxID=37329 RepID=UPI0024560999|nr:hypothetical protein [Nocardia farcinica]
MTALEIALTAGAVTSLGGLWLWIRQDGPIRLAAAFVAIFYADPARRRDARRVLGDVYRLGPALPPPRESQRRSPTPRRRSRPDPLDDSDDPDAA